MTDAAIASATPLDPPLYGATPAQAVSRFFRKYATFSGRAGRGEFWWSHLFVFVVNLLIWVPGIIIGVATGHREISATTGQPTSVPGPLFALFAVVGILFYLAILLPSISVAVRRLHDANFPGVLYLLVLLGGLGSIAILVLCAMDTNPKGVQYDAGAQPVAAPPLPPASA